jgi:AcrR family transcriptional regulator
VRASKPGTPQGAATKETRRGYHHGDLRAALIEISIQLIAERGVRDFSLAEASRRLGVAVSAPYAHFADRDDLFSAIAVHALQLFQAELQPTLARSATATERLALMARVYVRFAAKHRSLFQTLFDIRFDKRRHPEIEAAERPLEEAFLESVHALSPNGDEAASESLAAAVEAIAHGHAMLLLDGRFGRGQRAINRAAENAARATLALIDGRKRLAATSRPRS